MNQQRSRRFRTAQEAHEVREKAIRRGDMLPKDDPFDSNCITPGTVFMADLSQHLEYFLAKKVSEDSNWRDVRVIFSGHDVPGEGEHKIMQYIRTARSQPGYDVNTRHCFYGLDADLIMLGLVSHDPHFALLREQVFFGPRRNTRSFSSLGTQKFYLLHISLLREYLALEFASLRDQLSFKYNLERVIDDYILLHIFVGNDFLPHLPGLHINEGAIELLFGIYKRVLPKCQGYLNESGTLRPERLALVIEELKNHEFDNFIANNIPNTTEKQPKKIKRSNERTLTPEQHEWVIHLQQYAHSVRADPSGTPGDISFPGNLEPHNLEFLSELASKLNMVFTPNVYDPDKDTTSTVMSLPLKPCVSSRNDGDDHEAPVVDHREENYAAANRVLNSYLTPNEHKTDVEAEAAAAAANAEEIDKKWNEVKRRYFRDKLELPYTPEVIHEISFNYVEGLQWVLNYYYTGISSWGWYYHYHYAPPVSDLRDVADFKISFELGKPFRPFEQLMGVLPPLSRKLIPPVYQELMTDPSSPIIDFYPTRFESDLNGKKNSWEAVVKIPFIDEDRLLRALSAREGGLNTEERNRNKNRHAKSFVYDKSLNYTYPSSIPDFLPDLPGNHTRVEGYDFPSMKRLEYMRTLHKGVSLGVYAMPGFPSLDTLPHTSTLRKAGVTVHGAASPNFSMVINITATSPSPLIGALGPKLIGSTVYTNWPYLYESLVVGVSTNTASCVAKVDNAGKSYLEYNDEPIGGSLVHSRRITAISQYYYKQCAVVIGPVDVLVHVRPLVGMRRLSNGAVVKRYASNASDEIHYPLQLVVHDVKKKDMRFREQPGMTVGAEFPDGSKVLFLGMPGFGCPGRVIGSTSTSVTIEMAFIPDLAQENAAVSRLVSTRVEQPYLPSAKASARCGITPLVLSRITSTIMLSHGGQRVGIGLGLKSEAHSRKVLGYTRKGLYGWEYSEAAVQLVEQYKNEFPEIIIALVKSPADGGMYQSGDIFGDTANERVPAIRSWLKRSGVRDFEEVPLFADRLDSGTVHLLEKVIDEHPSSKGFKRRILKGLPRYALLRPEDAVFRVPEQSFAIGDRVINVLDFGSVPLAARGTVIGVNMFGIDVVFDHPFMSGSTLGGICSAHRGAQVGFAHVLNLSHPQMATHWGEENVADENVSPLVRTLRSESEVQNKKQPSNRPPNFFQAPKSKPTESSLHTTYDSLNKHLENLALSAKRIQVQKPRPAPPSVWRSPAANAAIYGKPGILPAPPSQGQKPAVQGRRNQKPKQQGASIPSTTKQGAQKQGAPKNGAPKQDVPKQDVPKQDVPKQDAPKQDAPKKGLHKQGGPKQGGPKQGGPKQGGPKQGGPKQGGPKQGGPKHGATTAQIPGGPGTQNTKTPKPRAPKPPQVHNAPQSN